jgi:hypothetical protein
MNQGQRIGQDINKFFAKSDEEQRERLEKQNLALAKQRRREEARAEKQRKAEEKARCREEASAEKERKREREAEREEERKPRREWRMPDVRGWAESAQAEAEEAVGEFAGGMERGKAWTEEKLVGGVGTGARAITTGERVAGSMIGAGGMAIGGMLFPEEKTEKITYGDRIVYPIGTVLRDGKYAMAWRVVKMPYKSINDAELVVGPAPLDAKGVDNAGAAYREVERLTGEPPVDLFVRLDELDEYEGIVESKSGLPKFEGTKSPKAKPRRNLAAAVGLTEVR